MSANKFFAEVPYSLRITVLDIERNPIHAQTRKALACCSNPSPEMYDPGNGKVVLRCANCGF